MASLILGTIGSTIGGPIGGFLGSAIGSWIDQQLFAPDRPDAPSPSVENLKGAASDPGAPISKTWGGNRTGGIIAYASPITIRDRDLEIDIGKAAVVVNQNYYVATIDIILNDGLILGIGRIWADGKPMRSLPADFEADSKANPYHIGAYPHPDWYHERNRAIINPKSFDILPLDEKSEAWLASLRIPTLFDEPYWVMDTSTYPADFVFFEQLILAVGTVFYTEYAYGKYFHTGEIIYWFDNTYKHYWPRYDQVVYTGGEPFYDEERNLIVPGINDYQTAGVPIIELAYSGPREFGTPLIFQYRGMRYNTALSINQERTNDVFGPLLERALTEQVSQTPSITTEEIVRNNNPFQCGGPGCWTRSGAGGHYSRTTSSYSVFTVNDFSFIHTWGGPSLVIDEHAFIMRAAGPVAVSGVTGRQYAMVEVQLNLLQHSTYNAIETINPDGSYTRICDIYGIEQLLAFREQRRFMASIAVRFDALKLGPRDNDYELKVTYKVKDIKGEFAKNITASDLVEEGPQFYYVVISVPPRTKTIEASASAQFSSERFSTTNLNLLSGSIWFDMGLTHPGPAFRGWEDYYNLYTAINDWSPISIFRYYGSKDVEIYYGTDDQPSSPAVTEIEGEAVPGYQNLAHIVFNEMELSDFGNRIPQFTVEVIRYERDTIYTVLEDLFIEADVSSDNYDLTSFTNLEVNPVTDGVANALSTPARPTMDEYILGYTLRTRTSFVKAMEAVVNAYRLDVAEINTAMKFRFKDRGPDHTIDYSELAAHPASDETTEANIAVTRQMKMDLPSTIEATYGEVERAYQNNTQRYKIEQQETNQLSATELGMTLYGTWVKAWTRLKMQDLWNGRVSVSIALPPKYVYVSPSDYILITTDKVIGTDNGVDVVAAFTVQVVSVRRGTDGILMVDGLLTIGTLYPIDDLDDFVTENNYTEWTNFEILTATMLIPLDIPPIFEGDQTYGAYLGVTANSDYRWPGTSVFRYSNIDQDDPVSIWRTNVKNTVARIVSGFIPDTYSGSTVTKDIAITIEVYDNNYTLPSATIAEMFDSLKTLCVIDDEIMVFETITPVAGKLYTLTGSAIRGLKNSVVDKHGPGATIIMLDETLFNWPALIGNRDQTVYLQAVTNGLPANHGILPFTNEGNRLKPFPVIPSYVYIDELNNITLNWIRQDRTFTEWRDGLDLEISETRERYDIEIFFVGNSEIGDGIASPPVRSIQVENTTTYTYTAAERLTDGFIGVPRYVFFRIYQISDSVGRGHVAHITAEFK